LYKQENEQKLQAQQVEFDTIELLLQEYQSLIASRNAIDVQRVSELSRIFLEKNYDLIKKYGQGLQHFVGCHAEFYFDIASSYNYWQRTLQHITFSDKSDDEKYLTQQNILKFLQLLTLLQNEKGILNPTKILGNKMISYLQSPDIYHYLTVKSLNDIKQSIHDTILQSNKANILEDLIPIIHTSLELLGVFKEQRELVATHFIQGVMQAIQELTSLQIINNKSEEYFIHKFFNLFLSKNQDDNTGYKRAQIADLARIQSFLVVNLLEKNQKS